MEIYIFTLFVNILMLFVCNGIHIDDENANHDDAGHFDGNRKGDEITQDIMDRHKDNESKNVFILSHIQPIKPKNNKRNAKKGNLEKISKGTDILQNQTSVKVKTTSKSKLNQNNLKSTGKYSTINEKLKETKIISTKKSSTVHGPITEFGSKLKQTNFNTSRKLSTVAHKLTTLMYARNRSKSTTPAMKKHKRFKNVSTDSSKRKYNRYKNLTIMPKRTKLGRIFKTNTKKSIRSKKSEYKKTKNQKPVRKQKSSTNKSNPDNKNNIFFRKSKAKYNRRNMKVPTKSTIKTIKNTFPNSETKISMKKQSLTKVPRTSFHRRKTHKSFTAKTTSKHSETQNRTLIPIKSRYKMDLKQPTRPSKKKIKRITLSPDEKYTRFTVQTRRTPTLKRNHISSLKQYSSIPEMQVLKSARNTFSSSVSKNEINRLNKSKRKNSKRMRELITTSMNKKSKNLRGVKNQIKKTTPKNSSRNKNNISKPRYRKNQLKRAQKPTVLRRKDGSKHYRNQITDKEKRKLYYKDTMSHDIQHHRRNQKENNKKHKGKSTKNTNKRYKTIDKSKHFYKHTALPKMISLKENRNKKPKTSKFRRIFYKTLLPKHSKTDKKRNLIPKIHRSRNVKKLTEKSKTKGRKIPKINRYRKIFDKSSLPLRYNSKRKEQKNVINSRNKLKNIRKHRIIPQIKNIERKNNKTVLPKTRKSNNKNEQTSKLKLRSRRRNKNKIVLPKKRNRTRVFEKAWATSGGRKSKGMITRTNKSKIFKNNKVINAHRRKNNLKQHKKIKSKNNTLTVMGQNEKPSQKLNNAERLSLKRSVKVNGTFVLDEGTNEWVIKKERNFTPDDYSLSPNETLSIDKPNSTLNHTTLRNQLQIKRRK